MHKIISRNIYNSNNMPMLPKAPMINYSRDKPVRLFNLYAVVLYRRISDLKIFGYPRAGGPRDKQIMFLESRVIPDYRRSFPGEVPEIYKTTCLQPFEDAPVNYVLTLEKYRDMMKSGEVFELFELAFHRFNILENSVVFATLVNHGHISKESVLYSP